MWGDTAFVRETNNKLLNSEEPNFQCLTRIFKKSQIIKYGKHLISLYKISLMSQFYEVLLFVHVTSMKL